MAIVWAEKALLQDGWAENVRITIGADGLIESVQAGAPAQGYKAGVLLPAPSNCHSHAFQRAMAGLTEKRGPDPSDSFWTWRQLMFRFLDRLTPDHVEAIAAFVQMEMLEAGYSANVEFHYLHHQPGGLPYANLAEMAQRIAAASATTGMGLTLLPVHYQYGGSDKRALGPGQIRFGNTLDAYAELHAKSAEALANLPADSRIGVAPHSLRAVAPEDLGHHARLAGNTPLHMHLAEQIAEVEEITAAYGKRPVEFVLDTMELSELRCFIHCTQMLPHETEALAKSGAVAGLCPITESSLGDGIFDAVRWLENGGSIAIGSDSNIRISLSEELRTLDYSQRLRDHSRAALATPDKSTGRRLFDAVNAGGATTSARNNGSLAVGKLADMLALKADSVDLIGRSGDTILDCYVFAGDDRMVGDVWSAGRHMVRDGSHVKREAIVSAYAKAMKELGEAI
ncbi:formimidoylglutamate deiminase [Hoeflea sp. YIM 152468]|uniref:formimidoylglutamate deiminase n=1 Tax=Hoeflea sp. YIM 152468 TaxID=3031759 RepID=UPI0023DB1CD2|nr:formimidoylglutamate deiminase [Hoeflea sp. YIM 152468]MDF1606708.1 formimidoylglutamate deiminase [Hoeflea sp. YIM 152468]